jgi:uncharacterized repeat protein (TIGR02543 family)
MAATSMPAWAVPTLADTGTEQVTSSSAATETTGDQETAEGTATTGAETESETGTSETTGTDAATDTDVVTDSAEEDSEEDSEGTVAQPSSSEDTDISIDSDTDDSEITITFDAQEGQYEEGDDEEATRKTWTREFPAGSKFGDGESAYRQGYLLLGWSTESDDTTLEYELDTMYDDVVPADGTTLYAVWTDASTTNSNANESMEQETVSEDEMKLYATSDKNITITLDGNGGTISGETTVTVDAIAGEAVGNYSGNVTREDYTFLGWSSKKDAKEPEWTDLTDAIFNSDTRLYAVWEKKCKLTFDGNGGFVSDGRITDSSDKTYTVSLDKGTRRYVSETAYRDGYVFIGWNTDKNGTTSSVDTNSYIDLNQDIYLYAIWAKASTAGYTVTLDMNGGAYENYESYKVSVKKGESVDLVGFYPDREGYIFDGWSLTKDGEVDIDGYASYVPTSNVTLYAVWYKPCWITIEASNFGGNNSVRKGEYLTYLPTVMYSDGKEVYITGWKDKATGKIYTREQILTTPVTEDHTYIAQADQGSCKVTLVSNDGSNEQKVYYVNKGDAITSVTAGSVFTRSGYQILGWSEDSKADGKDPDAYYPVDEVPAITKNTTLYAVWGPLCSITFNGNGGKMASDGKTTYTTEKSYSGYEPYSMFVSEYDLLEDGFERDGYALVGWSTVPEASEAAEGFVSRGDDGTKYLYLTSDTTVYAVWKKGCTLSLNYNGGTSSENNKEVQNIPVVSGNTVSESLGDGNIVGSRLGYVLAGWSQDKNAAKPKMTAAQMLAYQPLTDEEWYAVWVPIETGSTHTVHFSANGAGVSPEWIFESMTWSDSGYLAYIPNGKSINDMMSQNGPDYGLSFVKDGYVLAGWSKKSDATTADFKTAEELGAFKPTEDITLYAVWKPLNSIKLNNNSLTIEKGRKYTLKVSSDPKYAWDGTRIAAEIICYSSDTDIVDVDSDTGEITAKNAGKTVVSVACGGHSMRCVVTVNDGDQGIIYKSHVQKKGTLDWVEDGDASGTTGKSLRMEALYVNLADPDYLGSVEYRAYVQKLGWQDWSANGAMAGTLGKSLRLEAVQLCLTGEMAKHYDIYYCVHAQHFGWLNWAKNGESSGTAGYGYRLEALRIKLVKKGDAAPAKLGSDSASYHKNTGSTSSKKASVTYRSHVQTYGNLDWVSDGAMTGTKGKSKRMEAIYIKLASQPYSGNIEYKSHVQTYGWEQNWVKNGAPSGTEGQKKRLEAIRIRLTGEMAKHYDVYYRVYAQHFGWLGWAKNGASAGTAGFAYRLEGIQIKLVPKGQAAPGSTANAFRQNN